MGTRRVGYVVSRFPKLSETFVLREIDALEARGWTVELFPLLRGREQVVHVDATPWVQRVRAVPLLSLSVLVANVLTLLRTPRAWAGLWIAVVRGYAADPAGLTRALVLLPSCVHLARTVRREAVPQLHAHFATYPLLACWVVHQLTGTPYTVTVHAHDLFTSTAMLSRKLAPAGAVVAVSDFNRRFLAKTVGPDIAARTVVVHCGVDVERYSAAPAERGSCDGPTLLSVGSLEEHKGQRHLVDACRLLVGRGHAVRCAIVGEGPERGRLEQQIAAAGLAGVVTLLGARREDEVVSLLATADIYVQPSVVAADGQMEGIPVALMEALASRLPVVATSISGVPELVHDGDTGWLVPPGDAAALADAVEDVLSDPWAATTRATAGRTHVETEFDLRTNVAQLAAVLERVRPSNHRKVRA